MQPKRRVDLLQASLRGESVALTITLLCEIHLPDLGCLKVFEVLQPERYSLIKAIQTTLMSILEYIGRVALSMPQLIALLISLV